ncbi:hypothetical protein TRP8649_03719 [Pelagimonas phthalicica]|uniref:Methyltransferase FkbM domain-containing protein n=1 Tax=Pelagimonas phthalicica TaxID=1037362 RepID=A0A238JI07_9RHOB|nr:FkbM family methyltransferase [Pelagimonas phthalicica]TDS89244.1 FkbM family methyltransferase [Pelagimonas phthalicica]SMX29582.1 hypothetical protein TRP8649_03719 [Pelagimonas phthalicica]
MHLPSFLYRRLSRFVTCVLRVPGGGTLELDSKFQVASFQDVFMDPNYWRIFTLFAQEPKLVVDCGAHCGHFTVLTEICLRMRFGEVATQYVMVEPNDHLQPMIKRNLASANLSDRAQVYQAVVGQKSGTAMLETMAKNFLISSVSSSGTGQAVDYLDLAEPVGDRRIDLLKLDIEGAEFDFLKQNPDILAKTDNIVAEVHLNAGTMEAFDAALSAAGFQLDGPVMEAYGNRMVIYRRKS